MKQRQPTPVVAAGTVAAGAAVTVALPATFPADGGPTAADRAVTEPVHSALDAHPGVLHALVIPSDGYIVLPLLVAAAAWFAYRGRWWAAATMLIAPELTVAINTFLLKPLWVRPLHDYLAYPSGHTVQLVAVATAFVLLTDSARAGLAALGLTVVALALVAIGMIGLGYHLPTDIVGGAAAAIALTTALCWLAGVLHTAVDKGRVAHSRP
ncbi:phosphatase PAP2 family protein [Nocardia arthritidis]|uniref:Phosphatase PAP2 family protein n=1 Tax=Nocardia arthritidis TaxID=228602 RepID=A0A6G9YFK5_9NOCA|nr:phosphatase PAP2 family protein [Nocardia arthritidis]QIS11964.1 phosphatase PAP2 family protein [Nocardia arthritidis]